MVIHFYESVKLNPPPKDAVIIVNCGEEIPTGGDPIRVFWDDGRICARCLTIHNSRPRVPRLATFAFVELEKSDLAGTAIYWSQMGV